MRLKKVRGGNRRLEQVKRWIAHDLELDRGHLDGDAYFYSRFHVYPWRSSSRVSSLYPEPHGKIRKALIAGLIRIHDSWKPALDKTGKPYYLKIWLYQSRISRSEVVCATGRKIEEYENKFPVTKHQSPRMLPGAAEKNFEWSVSDDHDVYWEEDFLAPPEAYATRSDYLEQQKFYRQLQSNRITTIQATFSGHAAFLVKKGSVFVGGSKI